MGIHQLPWAVSLICQTFLVGEIVSQPAAEKPVPTQPEAKAQAPQKPAKSVKPSSPFANQSPDAMAGSLRGYLIRSLPRVLYEDSWNWGHQHPTPIRKVNKNDGEWRKVRITAPTLADTLVFDIRNVRKNGLDTTLFDLFISFDIWINYDKQTWKIGLKMYDGSVRARMRLKLLITCIAVTKVEKTSFFIPDVVFRLKVVKSNLLYDNFVVEHVSGVGGEMARVLGDAARAGMHDWKPSLERNLLAKANAAIVKAADTKEIRLGLGGAGKGKDPVVGQPKKPAPAAAVKSAQGPLKK